jgi:hypothetical protein
MKYFNLVIIVYIILFNSAGIAQTDKGTDSTKAEKKSGLIFKKELEHRIENSPYTDVIQLLNLVGNLKGLQFRILINKAADDSTVLIFKDIQKGSDLSDPSWILNYNVIKGPIVSNGASKYEISVVIYNSKQNGGLLPGNHFDLIKVKYKVAKLPDSKNNIKSSMKISKTLGSTFNGLPINITPTRDGVKIYIKKK